MKCIKCSEHFYPHDDCLIDFVKSHKILQLTCNCSSYTHYQAVLQIYNGLNPVSVDNIESQRARCLQTLFFPVMNESFSHHITVFVESVDYSVLGGHVLFTGQITPDQQLSSTSQNISPTLQFVTQRINCELLIPCLLVCVLLLLAAVLISHVHNIYLTVILALLIAWLSKQLEINSMSYAGNCMW